MTRTITVTFTEDDTLGWLPEVVDSDPSLAPAVLGRIMAQAATMLDEATVDTAYYTRRQAIRLVDPAAEYDPAEPARAQQAFNEAIRAAAAVIRDHGDSGPVDTPLPYLAVDAPTDTPLPLDDILAPERATALSSLAPIRSVPASTVTRNPDGSFEDLTHPY